MRSMVVVQAVGIDPGIRNLGVARLTFQIPTDPPLPDGNVVDPPLLCTRVESRRVDLLSDRAWGRGAEWQAAIESSRGKTVDSLLANARLPQTCAPDDTRPRPPAPLAAEPGAQKRRRRKRKPVAPKAWRSWRSKAPKTARLATSREMVQVASSATQDIVPTCTVPTIVYIESQPAGRASNAKIGAIALSMFSSIRSRMVAGGEPLLACEMIPPARKYSIRDVYGRLGVPRPDGEAACAGTRRPRSGGYRGRKAESCRIAESLISRLAASSDESPSSDMSLGARSSVKVDDEADAIILAYLAASDVASHLQHKLGDVSALLRNAKK